MIAALGWLWRGGVLGILAFLIFGPLANLVLWAVAIQWYFPHKLPLTYGLRYWGEVFKPTSDAFASLGTSILIAVITVIVCLVLAIPAGYALGRRSLPGRGFILLIILLPQAFPSVAVYLNIARLFYMVGLNGTITGVVLVHAVHGLVIAVWIAAVAFAAVDVELELAARNMGGTAHRAHGNFAIGRARSNGGSDLRLSRVARRVYRHLLCGCARHHDLAADDVYREPRRELPDRGDYRADPAGPFDRLHAVDRALSEHRDARQSRLIKP
jgi:hypothetical protein